MKKGKQLRDKEDQKREKSETYPKLRIDTLEKDKGTRSNRENHKKIETERQHHPPRTSYLR